MVYISSGGNYSIMVLHDKTEYIVSMNLAEWERLFDQQLRAEDNPFIRIGKQHIINREYIFKINLTKLKLVLADLALNHTFELEASREALRQLKELLESELKEEKA